MTTEPRPDVTKALAAAGWTVDTATFAIRHQHPSGAALIVYTDRNVTKPADSARLFHDGPLVGIDFPATVPNAVIVAAALAAAKQLDPVQDRADAAFLGRLCALGVDNWDGYEEACQDDDE